MGADRHRAARPATTRGLKNVSVRSVTAGSIELVFQPSTRAPADKRPLPRRARSGRAGSRRSQQLVAADEERPGLDVGHRVAELLDGGLGVLELAADDERVAARRSRPTAPSAWVKSLGDGLLHGQPLAGAVGGHRREGLEVVLAAVRHRGLPGAAAQRAAAGERPLPPGRVVDLDRRAVAALLAEAREARKFTRVDVAVPAQIDDAGARSRCRRGCRPRRADPRRRRRRRRWSPPRPRRRATSRRGCRRRRAIRGPCRASRRR